MTDFIFADRYAEAGLAPTSEVVSSRQAPAERIVGAITNSQILNLASHYYGNPGLELTWFRDEFAKEDASFSLINNERETRVLAAAILGDLVADEVSVAILAVLVGGVAGHRAPAQAAWLVSDAENALKDLAIAERTPANVDTKAVTATSPKLSDEIPALAANDWPNLLLLLGKMRAETQTSAKASAKTLSSLIDQVRYLREESQMLWWLYGGHSRALVRSFGSLSPFQAALVGAVDLGDLTTVTSVGPVAAPAILERVIAMAKRPKGAVSGDLGSAVDGLDREGLRSLRIFPDKLSPRLAPVTAAIELARTIGAGAWHASFLEKTGFKPTISFEPVQLASQLYREHLLGQLL